MTRTLTSTATGFFPAVKHLRNENDYGEDNIYSLQLNSNFMRNNPACAGATNPRTCFAGQQFVYSTLTPMVFMQYWLVQYGSNPCPHGWIRYTSACFKNSAAVRARREAITELPHLTLSGTVVKKGIDTVVLTTKGRAYSTTGRDSVLFLANDWKASEFNVLGAGGGTEAEFNAGTALTVEIDLKDGTSRAPICKPHDGRTGETNNLDLRDCAASGGAVPSVKFTEALKKA